MNIKQPTRFYRSAKVLQKMAGDGKWERSEAPAAIKEAVHNLFSTYMEDEYENEIITGDWSYVEVLPGDALTAFANMVNTGFPRVGECDDLNWWNRYADFMDADAVQKILPEEYNTGAKAVLYFITGDNDTLDYVGGKMDEVFRGGDKDGDIPPHLFDLAKATAYFSNAGFYEMEMHGDKYLVRIMDEVQEPLCCSEIEIYDL